MIHAGIVLTGLERAAAANSHSEEGDFNGT